MTNTTTDTPRKPYRQITLAQAKRQGLRVSTYTAGELAQFLPADGGLGTMMVSFGHVRGEETFGLEHLRRNAENGGIDTILPDGNRILGRPNGRAVRVLTR